MGGPNPGRTAPEPDSVPRPHNNDCGEGQGCGPAGRSRNPRAARAAPPPRVRGPTDSKPLRKEVIQPHLPVRLPCYDFVPITGPAFDRSPWGHGLRASPTFMT